MNNWYFASRLAPRKYNQGKLERGDAMSPKVEYSAQTTEIDLLNAKLNKMVILGNSMF